MSIKLLYAYNQSAGDINLQWRGLGMIEVMVRNRTVAEFVEETEREIERLWTLIATVAAQTDLEWGRKLAQQAIEEHALSRSNP